jgi:hypothetical protein
VNCRPEIHNFLQVRDVVTWGDHICLWVCGVPLMVDEVWTVCIAIWGHHSRI